MIENEKEEEEEERVVVVVVVVVGRGQKRWVGRRKEEYIGA